MSSRFPQPLVITWLIWALLALVSHAALAELHFTEVGLGTGAAHEHVLNSDSERNSSIISGGVAAGDYDRDGDVDLYLVTGDGSPNVLLRNNGAAQFVDVALAAGVGLEGHLSSGPAFADIDADGFLDLMVGGVSGSGYYVFRNRGDGTFEDSTAASGMLRQSPSQNDFSSAFGDPDGDGDLDLFVSHWGADQPTNHLWLNMGDGRFAPMDERFGITVFADDDWTFSPVFTDINGDARQDLLVAADFGTSEVLLNAGSAGFERMTDRQVISDENGMGTAAADFDNDGDTDWFVSSIWDPEATVDSWGGSGNRMYRNDGLGNFTDVTDETGVRVGHWGWGACAADFNNDGWLDLFHVNGYPTANQGFTVFDDDPSRLFINNGKGGFLDRSAETGTDDVEQGRGVVCFDADLDGDIDLFVTNYRDRSKLYRNDLGPNPGWLQVRVKGEPSNPHAVGAVITLETDGLTQRREIIIGSNFASQNPLMQHFGLGDADSIHRLHVRWPHGGQTEVLNPSPNQVLTVDANESALPAPFALEPGISAAWYDPDRNGEGFVIEILEADVAVAYWFTYTAGGEQDWYVMVGEIDGNRILFPEVLTVSGGKFGAGFEPASIKKTVAGQAAFTWQTCDSGFMDWLIDGEYGRMNLVRLSGVMGIDCGQPVAAPEIPEGRYSGSWFDPAHDGEGYVLELLRDGRVLVYWFTFDPLGNRRWLWGVGRVIDGRLVFDDMLTTSGPPFGAEYDAALLQVIPWGALELDIGCDGGAATYTSTELGFGNGGLNIQRLTKLAGLTCNQP